MEVQLARESEVPLRAQLAGQIIYLIVTEKLKPGEPLPSVRQLARQLKIHHNTVSEAYQELFEHRWPVRKRGARLIVRPTTVASEEVGSPRTGLDDLINDVIRLAREQGFSLQALRTRVRERLLAEPPDHILVVEQEPGLRRLLEWEILKAVRWPVEGCDRENLARSPGLAIGALAAAAQHAMVDVDCLCPKDRPPVALAFTSAEEHLDQLRRLREPSLIAVVSGSEAFLETAAGYLAPAVGRRHSLRKSLLPLRTLQDLGAVDIVFCDSIAFDLLA